MPSPELNLEKKTKKRKRSVFSKEKLKKTKRQTSKKTRSSSKPKIKSKSKTKSKSKSKKSANLRIIVSEDGESEYEAYHAVFSWLTSTKYIYTKLAEMCGSTFQQNSNLTGISHSTIFCDGKSSTHYLYYDHKLKKTFDPYTIYQLNNTHGNCFIFALYLSSVYNNSPVFDESADGLINISDIIVSEEYEIKFARKHKPGDIIKYNRVNPAMKQRAYKTFVHNDFIAINLLLTLLGKHPDILGMYTVEWQTIPLENRKHYGIPKGYMFDDYFEDLCELAKYKKNTYMATKDQIENWDLEENREGTPSEKLEPYENSGIKNANEIDFSDYEI